jgi:hypothetical protein
MDREFAVPVDAFILHLFDDDSVLKSFDGYVLAKAGDKEAALSLIGRNVLPWLVSIKHRLPCDAVYVAPFAKEATGDNAIPQILADACAIVSGGEVDMGIVQTTRVFHTGADPMERLMTRPMFEGEVVRDQSYVLVDDVTTMGGTLAELSNYIQANGGKILGIVVIVNAGRDKKFTPSKRIIGLLNERFGDEIKRIFGIALPALTVNEANYLVGFRSIDEIRNRCFKARKEIDLRLRSKGIVKVP